MLTMCKTHEGNHQVAVREIVWHIKTKCRKSLTKVFFFTQTHTYLHMCFCDVCECVCEHTSTHECIEARGRCQISCHINFCLIPLKQGLLLNLAIRMAASRTQWFACLLVPQNWGLLYCMHTATSRFFPYFSCECIYMLYVCIFPCM